VAQQPAAHKGVTTHHLPRDSKGALPRPKEYKPDCEHPHDREESDLCAQWGAVGAARRANDLTAAANRAIGDANAISAQTLIWTRAGFITVLATLIATGWAAWAAGRAASIADKSMKLFRDSESAFLAPSISLTNGGSCHKVRASNRGRTPATVIHADFTVYDEPPQGPIPFVVHVFPSDLMIAEGTSYEFGEFRFETDSRIVYFIGGVIYKDFFWRPHLCRIAARVDRQTGEKQVVLEVDYSEWEEMISNIQPERWWKLRKRKVD
jgi:hypothetical protein